MRENAQAKAKRILGEGRVILRWVTAEPNEERIPIAAVVRGDSGRAYEVLFDRDPFDWTCDCKARGLCSHVIALQLITDQPKPGPGGVFPE